MALKTLSPTEIAALRARWDSDAPFVAILRGLKEWYDDMLVAVQHRNSRASDKLDNVTVPSWLQETTRDMFQDLMPIASILAESDCPQIESHIAGTLYDLRGFPLKRVPLCDAMVDKLDLSYIAEPSYFNDSTLINCLALKSCFRHEWMPHSIKSSYFQECDFAEAWFNCTYIEDCRFFACKLRYPQTFTVHARNTVFEKCSFRSAYVAYSLFINVRFIKCCFVRASFVSASLETSRFINCVFEDCEWTLPSQQPKYWKCERPIVEEIPPDKIDPLLLK